MAHGCNRKCSGMLSVKGAGSSSGFSVGVVGISFDASPLIPAALFGVA